MIIKILCAAAVLCFTNTGLALNGKLTTCENMEIISSDENGEILFLTDEIFDSISMRKDQTAPTWEYTAHLKTGAVFADSLPQENVTFVNDPNLFDETIVYYGQLIHGFEEGSLESYRAFQLVDPGTDSTGLAVIDLFVRGLQGELIIRSIYAYGWGFGRCN